MLCISAEECVADLQRCVSGWAASWDIRHLGKENWFLRSIKSIEIYRSVLVSDKIVIKNNDIIKERAIS